LAPRQGKKKLRGLLPKGKKQTATKGVDTRKFREGWTPDKFNTKRKS